MPEHIQCEHAVESGEACETSVGERPIDQKMCVSVIAIFIATLCMPRLEHREFVQHCQSCIGHEPACIQSPQSRLAAKRLDSAVACRGPHKVHHFEFVAKPEICGSGV